MAEHPILFTGEMVKAILDDRKTQTRRIVTCPRNPRGRRLPYEPWEVEEDGRLLAQDEYGDYCPIEETQQPYGVAGDRLWVRHTWWHLKPEANPRNEQAWDESTRTVRWPTGETVRDCRPCLEQEAWRKRPSIHMPRWASRITLEVEAVRVERLQEISHADIRAEGTPGIHHPDDMDDYDRGLFRSLWDSINGARPGCAWENNPWIWKVEFHRI